MCTAPRLGRGATQRGARRWARRSASDQRRPPPRLLFDPSACGSCAWDCFAPSGVPACALLSLSPTTQCTFDFLICRRTARGGAAPAELSRRRRHVDGEHVIQPHRLLFGSCASCAPSRCTGRPKSGRAHGISCARRPREHVSRVEGHLPGTPLRRWAPACWVKCQRMCSGDARGFVRACNSRRERVGRRKDGLVVGESRRKAGRV